MIEACRKLENNSNLRELYEAFGALANPTRLKIICAISAKEQSVLEITKFVGTSQSNASQQLTKLYDLNIIKRRKEKNNVLYSLKDKRVLQLFTILTGSNP